MGVVCSTPKEKNYIVPLDDKVYGNEKTVNTNPKDEALTIPELTATLAIVPVGAIVFDAMNSILYSNISLKEMMGYEVSDLVGRNLSEFVGEETLSGLQSISLLNTIFPESSRFVHFKNSKGEMKSFSFKIKSQNVISPDNPRKIETIFVMFLQPMSPQQSQLAAIKDTLLQLSAIPILGTTSKGILTVYNKAAEETFGWKIEEALGKNCSILIPERIAKYHDQFIANYVRTGVGKVVDRMRKENALKKNGSSFPIELKITCIRGPTEPMFIGYARDRSAIITREEESQRAALADQIFPVSIAARVSNGDKIICDFHDNASLLFCDIKGYTALSTQISPRRMVKLLDDIFSGFDAAILEILNVEKIKTIGDCYMLGSGFPGEFKEHASELVNAAILMLQVMEDINKVNTDLPVGITLRFGISSGPVICGIVGKKKPLYDCWSSTVNIASRMESTGIPGEIQVTEETYSQLKLHHRHMFYERGNVEVKGKGVMTTYITNFTGHLPHVPKVSFKELARISSDKFFDEKRE